ncbi:hypothetical protein J517_4100, partial [Acinetobacter baumannii 118362]
MLEIHNTPSNQNIALYDNQAKPFGNFPNWLSLHYP